MRLLALSALLAGCGSAACEPVDVPVGDDEGVVLVKTWLQGPLAATCRPGILGARAVVDKPMSIDEVVALCSRVLSGPV
ncbi:MAG: hypothetical protein Q8P41_22935 [Pseudomonadota bacterium]|nr:hypothetical protein [Pseudomonadota bacterium]